MQTPTPEIRKVLCQRLVDALPLCGVTASDVAWPNVPFSPNAQRIYIEPFCLFGETRQASLSDSGFELLKGIFQITVYGVLATGEADLEETARALTDLYRMGTRLYLADDQNPVDIMRSYRSSLHVETGGNDLSGQIMRPTITVSAEWQHYVSRGE